MAKDLVEEPLNIDAILKHSISEGQQFFQFKNGWCLSVICNEFSYGIEACLGKWRIRESSLLEKIQDWWYRKKQERIEWDIVSSNILKHSTWREDGVYAYLKPPELEEIKNLIANLKPWTRWEGGDV